MLAVCRGALGRHGEAQPFNQPAGFSALTGWDPTTLTRRAGVPGAPGAREASEPRKKIGLAEWLAISALWLLAMVIHASHA